MSKLRSIPLSVAVLLIVSQACVLPSVVTTPDSNLIGTMVMQTSAAGFTQTAGAVTLIAGSQTPTTTFTPLPPTDTPTATLSPTPFFTSTPLKPQISVSVATNCRVGPGMAYDRVGALLVGEFAEVVGRNPTGNYWYIRNPDSSTGFCWLWGEYATVSGNTVALPIYTPPPTPTPTPLFEVDYVGMDSCVGWWLEFRLENIGETPFRSITLTVRDTKTDTTVSMEANGFTNVDGCTDSNTNDALPVDGARRVSSPAFAYDPTGHKLRATVTLCTGKGQSGTCASEVIEFKP